MHHIRIDLVLNTALIVYVIGVAVGLLRVDAAPVTRIAVAMLWPLGVIAGVITVGGLLLAAMVLFPTVGAAVVVAAALIWLVAG
jgi:hypothetical protein